MKQKKFVFALIMLKDYWINTGENTVKTWIFDE